MDALFRDGVQALPVMGTRECGQVGGHTLKFVWVAGKGDWPYLRKATACHFFLCS